MLPNAQAQPTSEEDDERVIREGIRLSGLVGAATEEVHDGSQGETTEDESEEQDDELNQDEVLRRALDEAAVEREQAALDGDQGGNRPEGVTSNDLLEASLFPTLPTHIPEPEPEPEPELDPVYARLQALNASTAVPVVNPKPASGPGAPAKAFNYSLPGFDLAKDDDLTSWCCAFHLLAGKIADVKQVSVIKMVKFSAQRVMTMSTAPSVLRLPMGQGRDRNEDIDLGSTNHSMH